MPADAPSFQHQLDWTLEGETLLLDLPRERAGPVRVLNAITLDGDGCTVRAQTGPVVHVVSGGVTLRNLRIEQTGDDSGRGVALKVDHPDVELDRVTVRGAVVGLKAEEGAWRYPHQLNLGTQPRRPTALHPDAGRPPPSHAANPPAPVAPPEPPSLPSPPVRGSLRIVTKPLIGTVFKQQPVEAPPPAEVGPPPESVAPAAPPEPTPAVKKPKPPPAIPSWAKASGSEPPTQT